MFRIVVIGAGGVGSAAARFLARDGHDVTVLDQFHPDHDRGSSFGTSRIIRKTYTDAFYTRLMGEAYPLWDELERESGESLFARSGGFFFEFWGQTPNSPAEIQQGEQPRVAANSVSVPKT